MACTPGRHKGTESGRKGRSREADVSGQWEGRHRAVKGTAVWTPTRNGTATPLGEDGSQPCLLLASWLRTPVEFRPSSVALWGNDMIIIATDYSALSVCLGGTQGTRDGLGSRVRTEV